MNLGYLFDLQPFFTFRAGESEDEVFLKPSKGTYSAEEILTILLRIHELEPDELFSVGDEIRLWWD